MNQEEKSFFELWKEEIEMHIDEDADIEETVKEIYNNDYNFKHADPTTHKRINDSYEIQCLLEAGIEEFKTYPDRCSECARILQDDDYITQYEGRPYGESEVMENVTIGHVCSHCGDEETY